MLKNSKLGIRLIAALLGVGLIPSISIGVIALINSSNSLTELAFRKLENGRENKKTHLTYFFSEREKDMNSLILAAANFRQAAYDKMKTVHAIKKLQVEQYFQRYLNDIKVISQNNMVAEALESFTTAIKEDGGVNEAMYNFLEKEKYGTPLKQFKEIYGYYDLLLIAKNGTVVYTLNRESDFAQNLITGELKNSALGRAFENSLTEPVIEDYSLYAPSGNQHVLFVAAPIQHHQHTIGTVVLKLSKEAVNAIMQQRQGLGRNGESYLVGKAGGRTSYRNDRVIRKVTIGDARTEDFIEKALSGESGFTVKLREDQGMRLILYDPLKIPGLNWTIITSISLEEAVSPVLEGETEDFFAKYIRQYGYYDLLMIHPEGSVFYSVLHQSDYKTNLLTGAYADSGLGRVFRKVSETKAFGFEDFQPYAASEGKPSAFIAQPLIHNGQIEFIVAMQFFYDDINRVMKDRTGMGKTEETYLVGPDHLMRSDSYLHPETYSLEASFGDPSRRRLDTASSREAIAGKTGRGIMISYAGNRVLSAYTPITVWDKTWALIAEIDQSEALAPVIHLKQIVGMVMIVAAAAIVLMALQLSRTMVRPIRRVVTGLVKSVEKMSSVSEQMSSSSLSLSEGSSRQAAALEQTSASIEEISSQICQNALHAEQTHVLMSKVSWEIHEANAAIDELTRAMTDISEASRKTSDIINAIDEIAFQTRLLALNAAIESAHAGQAGAGFSVVAGEVQNLAARAAESATLTQELIENTIKTVSNGLSSAVKTQEAFKSAASIAEKISVLIDDITMASKQQAHGIEQISAASIDMDGITQQNASNAEETASISEEMKTQAKQLKKFVEELVTLIGKRNQELIN